MDEERFILEVEKHSIIFDASILNDHLETRLPHRSGNEASFLLVVVYTHRLLTPTPPGCLPAAVAHRTCVGVNPPLA